MKNIVEVENLTKYYKKFRALNSVSFTVEEGEIFGFLGPNGAGKSTTVRILNTLLLPTSGRVFMAGHDLGKEPYEVKARIGLVPEISNPYLELSCYENLLFTGRLFGMKNRDIRSEIDNLLDFFELESKRDVKAEFLSKGLRRRLTIAMGLINRPKLLFLDEPVSGLDIQSARLIKRLIREANEKGTTIFITTHQLNVANDLCDRIAIIQDGEIKALDSPDRLKKAAKQSQAVEIHLDKLKDVDIKELKSLKTVERVDINKGQAKLFTEHPEILYPLLISWAERNNIRIEIMNTLSPTLEDVFIEITGKGFKKGPEGQKKRHKKV
ncbi:MAG: ATP-binding cassette domain-containing protein [Spirochaetales bacterium]|nr:ATP-binding cassette domain-containing protein [Spirochaetales bacterium]